MKLKSTLSFPLVTTSWIIFLSPCHLNPPLPAYLSPTHPLSPSHNHLLTFSWLIPSHVCWRVDNVLWYFGMCCLVWSKRTTILTIYILHITQNKIKVQWFIGTGISTLRGTKTRQRPELSAGTRRCPRYQAVPSSLC